MTYTVIGRDKCVYCDKATGLLDTVDRDFTYYSIEDFPWLRSLILKAGHKTVPIIFDGQGKEIGGYSDLVALLKDSTDD